MKITSIPYLGGKSTGGQVGKWINETIGPTHSHEMWCDWFFGMGGMTFQRPFVPGKLEWVNDADEFIADWFRVVQNPIMKDHLKTMLVDSQHSTRAIYIDTLNQIDNDMHAVYPFLHETEDILLRAWATTYCLMRSATPALDNSMHWAVERKPTARLTHLNPANLDALSRRLQNVQIDCRDALELLDQVKDSPNFHIYIDPPYPDTAGYRCTVDQSELDTLLMAQKCRVAVSGFSGDRPRLEAAGWQVYSFERSTTFNTSGVSSKRMEQVWLNYEPENTLFTL